MSRFGIPGRVNRRRRLSTYVICASIAALLTARSALAEEPAASADASASEPKATPDENPTAGYIPGYRRAVGLGLSPMAPMGPAVPGLVTEPFSASDDESDWQFNFKGYMSASMRASGFGFDFTMSINAGTTDLSPLKTISF